MLDEIQAYLEQNLNRLSAQDIIPPLPEDLHLSYPKNSEHGDFYSNIALILARQAGLSPSELGHKIKDHLTPHPNIAKIEVAPNGFINIHLTLETFQNVVKEIHKNQNFGSSKIGKNARVLIEFVSANPTGPLHVGHGRGAAYGLALSKLMETSGYRVDKEYYVNDAGRQIDILIASVYLHYQQLHTLASPYPKNAYQGDYVKKIATALERQHGASLLTDAALIYNLNNNNLEESIDAFIKELKTGLGERIETLRQFVLERVLLNIKKSLTALDINFDNWFSERSLESQKLTEIALTTLQKKGHTFLKEDVLWFRSTAFGDDKDRALKRKNGTYTYFAKDIAYHHNKFTRGYDHIIDVLGADHHGYVTRIKASMQALGHDQKKFSTCLVQFANLVKNGKNLNMSTRTGEFLELSELTNEIGKDALHFFYNLYKSDQHMNFDLDLAKQESLQNPVYYVQYAHARICSILRKDNLHEGTNLQPLKEPHERNLMQRLSRYPQLVQTATNAHAPHQVIHYLKEVATLFHSYYNEHEVLVEDIQTRRARISLISACKKILSKGLALLSINAPEKM